MKTAGSLTEQSKKELADLARRRGIRGWEGMDKGALVKALSRTSSAGSTKGPKPKGKSAKPASVKSVAKLSKPKPSATRITRPAKKAKPGKATSKAPAKVSKSTKPQAKSTGPTKPVPRVSTPAPSKPVPASAVAAVAKPTVNGSHKTTPTPATKRPVKPISAVKPLPAAKPLVTKTLTQHREVVKEATASKPAGPPVKDRILLAVPDPYWLHAIWNLSSQSIQRAEAALKQDWHGAKLIIRLFDVTSQDTTSTSETPIRDIVVQGSGNTWYIDVQQPPRMYRADIGYLSRRGEFWPIARSNVVTPPRAGSESLESGWDDSDAKWKAERMLAMSTGFESAGNPELRELFEERLGRSIGPPKETAFGTGAMPPGSVKKFFFEIDAKLIVFGRTDPTAHLTLNNDPIKLNSDGTFMMPFSLPDSRQIIPAVAASADGVEERTIVLAIERNTKHLDPMIHDQMNEV
ncbi:MAG: DUF4912 domain-containing protein [Planctomycetia bacterium]|nr:DUF4912 domain-containing protein [Planctomycetia bacterium]